MNGSLSWSSSGLGVVADGGVSERLGATVTGAGADVEDVIETEGTGVGADVVVMVVVIGWSAVGDFCVRVDDDFALVDSFWCLLD